MTRNYTRTGDDGTTGRLGGGRLRKTSPILDAIGAIDEANAAIGLARTLLKGNATLDRRLRKLQDTLFRIGADLSAPFREDHRPGDRRIGEGDTAALEAEIDAIDRTLPELGSFLLPSGTEASAALQLSRAIIRRCEREVLRAAESGESINPALLPYLNRLSSYLFVLARLANHQGGATEEHPDYGA